MKNKFKFRSQKGSVQDLATRMRNAGHKDVQIRGDVVFMTPFEPVGNVSQWVGGMEAHFVCKFLGEENAKSGKASKV